ncbi:hypothetical protein GCM10027514_39630 [Azotobacter armeniacus]
MVERPWLITAALLAGSLAHAVEPPVDEDGFKRPLSRLHFNPSLDQHEFERSSLAILNVHDPWERWNRRVYYFNYRFDEWVLLPVVRGYRYIIPGFVRSSVRNFFGNLAEIPTLLNSLLQLRGRRALDTGARLLLNTTPWESPACGTRPAAWGCPGRARISARLSAPMACPQTPT